MTERSLAVLLTEPAGIASSFRLARTGDSTMPGAKNSKQGKTASKQGLLNQLGLLNPLRYRDLLPVSPVLVL